MLKNNRAFTLIEMLIVLMIISVLIILIVPTISNSKEEINKTGCEALKSVVQTQVELYNFEKGSIPDMEELLAEKYISDSQKKCPDGSDITILQGKVE